MMDIEQKASSTSWWHALKSVWIEAGEKNFGLIAAGIAFNAFLALIPLLTIVVLVYGIVAEPEQVARDIAALGQTLPREAADLIGDQLQSVVETSGGTTGFGLVLALALAIYGAMRGANGIVSGLNIVCDVEEARSFLHRTRVAVAITLGLGLVLIAASFAISALGFIESLLPGLFGLASAISQIVIWIVAGGCVSLVISAIYHRAPNRPVKTWRWVTPGSLAATIGWVAATLAFAFYVRNFGSYNATYGALGAVIVLLIWLSLSAHILLLGAQLNLFLERRTAAPQPLDEGSKLQAKGAQ